MGAAAATGLSSIVGSSNADTLIGDASSSISGGAGNDSITGGASNDTLLGEAGNDTISGGAGNDNIDGGEGNDQIVVASGNITANDTVSGGDGSADILSYTTYVAAADNDATVQARVSNFEILRIAGVTGGAEQALSMANYVNNAGFTTLQLGAGNANTDGVNLSNASATLNTLAVIAAAAGTNTFDRLVDTSTDSLTISNSTATAGAASTITALTALDEETITVTASVPTTAGANDLTITTLTVADLTTLNITSASDVIITTLAGAARLATVDATTATGVVTVSAANTGVAVTMTANSNSTAVNTLTGGAFADSITGGAGADVLVGGLGADTINGGAGADDITGGAGADLMNGGAGIDTFNTGVDGDSVVSSLATFAGATVAAGDTLAFANGVDVITGFASTDLLAGGQANTATTALIAGALVAANYVAYGTYANGVFTAATAFNATTAKDALVAFGVANGQPTGVDFTGYVVLDDLTAALAAANFV